MIDIQSESLFGFPSFSICSVLLTKLVHTSILTTLNLLFLCLIHTCPMIRIKMANGCIVLLVDTIRTESIKQPHDVLMTSEYPPTNYAQFPQPKRSSQFPFHTAVSDLKCFLNNYNYSRSTILEYYIQMAYIFS